MRQAKPKAINAQERAGEDARREGEAKAQAKEIDGVREQADAEIGDDQNNEEAAEEEPLEGGEGDAESVVSEDEEGAGEELDDGIHGRDGEGAVTAFSVEEKPTEERDVVVRLDESMAARAAGGGADNGKSFRDAGDADI